LEVPVRIVSCGHIFGERCLMASVTSSLPHSRKCPMCRGLLFTNIYSVPQLQTAETPRERLRRLESDGGVADLILEYDRVENFWASTRRRLGWAIDYTKTV
jgi:hypothetical protein